MLGQSVIHQIPFLKLHYFSIFNISIFLKPHLYFEKISSENENICLCEHLLKIFRFGKILTRWQLSFSDQFSFLKTWVTSFIFIQEENLNKLIPLFISVKRIFKKYQHSSQSSLSEYQIVETPFCHSCIKFHFQLKHLIF